ncbi:hypothetical protein NKG94_49875 [Micromonospora sp. M12]
MAAPPRRGRTGDSGRRARPARVDATSPTAIADALATARAVDRDALPETVVLTEGVTRALPGPVW